MQGCDRAYSTRSASTAYGASIAVCLALWDFSQGANFHLASKPKTVRSSVAQDYETQIVALKREIEQLNSSRVEAEVGISS